MSSHINLRNRLRGVFRSAATLLVSCSAFLLAHSAWAKPRWIPPGWLKHPEHHPLPAVPEVNAGLVLIPTAIVVMLLSSLQLFRGRAAQRR